MLPSPLTLVAAVVNRLLTLDPHSQQQLAQLQGHWIAIKNPVTDLYIQFTATGIHLAHQCDTAVAATIEGSLVDLLRFAQADEPMIGQGVQLSGDVALLQRLQRIAQQLDLDWDGWLARWLGDVPTHYLSQGAKASQQWLTQFEQRMAQNLNEYLHEEQRLLPSAIELENFYHKIDELRDDSERLLQRMSLLEKQVQQP